MIPLPACYGVVPPNTPWCLSSSAYVREHGCYAVGVRGALERDTLAHVSALITVRCESVERFTCSPSARTLCLTNVYSAQSRSFYYCTDSGTLSALSTWTAANTWDHKKHLQWAYKCFIILLNFKYLLWNCNSERLYQLPRITNLVQMHSFSVFSITYGQNFSTLKI